jgi:hypothetical protein
MVFLGYEESSRLHLITEQVVQLLMLRERWGIRENGVATTLVTAAIPPALAVRGKFTDTLIIKLLLDKFSLGVPFNRQCQELNAWGAEVTRSTVSDQLQTAVAPLEPIAAAVRDQILAEPFIPPMRRRTSIRSVTRASPRFGWLINSLSDQVA